MVKISNLLNLKKRRLFLAFTFSLCAVLGQAQMISTPIVGALEQIEASSSKIKTTLPNHLKAGQGVIVAVIDSGVREDIPGLQGKLLPGADLVSAERNPRHNRSNNFAPDSPSDVCPLSKRQLADAVFVHGTDVASTIVMNGGNGVAGIVPIKVTGACEASRRDLIDGLLWAAGFHIEGLQDNDNPAQIINISMAGGGNSCNQTLQKTISSILDKGIVIVSAAGNTFGGSAREPAVCNGVISVGSINPDQSKTYYTAVDERISLYALGNSLVSADELSFFDNSFRNTAKVSSCETDSCSHIAPASVNDLFFGTSYSAALISGKIASAVLK